MKIRNGFVSNSSSLCFILCKRDRGVKRVLERISARPPESLSRSTAMAVGRDAVAFAREFMEEYDEDWACDLPRWILRWAEVLGEDDIVFLRESDEGLGGYLFHPYIPPPCEKLDEETNRQMSDMDREDVICPYGRGGGSRAYRLLHLLAVDEMEYH